LRTARALSWSDDRTLRLWELENGTSRALEGHDGSVSGAVVLADGARALSWSYDCTLRLWDLETGGSRALEGHRNGVSGAVVLADGKRALSWSHDLYGKDTLRLWDLESGTSCVLQKYWPLVRSLAIGASLVLYLLELREPRRPWVTFARMLVSDALQILERRDGLISGAVVSGDGTRALSWTDHGALRLCDLESGALRVLERCGVWVRSAVVLADGARALSWSDDHTLRLWDLKSGASRVLEGHGGRVRGAVALGDGARALSWSDDHTLRLWDLSSLAELARFVGDYVPTCCAVSVDGTLAVLGASRGRVLVFDLPS
jgi:WD40 repeat protein